MVVVHRMEATASGRPPMCSARRPNKGWVNEESPW